METMESTSEDHSPQNVCISFDSDTMEMLPLIWVKTLGTFPGMMFVFKAI